METSFTEISVKGKIHRVPSAQIENWTIVVTGKWLKTSAIHDEHWQAEDVRNPEAIIAELKKGTLDADIFTFAQKLPDTQPKFNYPREWENIAAVPITSFKEWWEDRLPQETRKNVRRAGRRGVITRRVEFDDVLVRGIKGIYDETPVRQGRRFWHYGKDLETIKRENSSYLDQCEFVGAFQGEELIGFLKMVHMGRVSSIMQIISKNAHYDKRPANTLIAKAVEICEAKGMSHFIYGQYVYGNNEDAPLTEFKRRNGFEKILLPRYFVPLTAKGSLCLKLNLHRGFRRLLPRKVESTLLRLRTRVLERKHSPRAAVANPKNLRLEEG